MLQSWRKPAKLFSDFNTLQFAGVMGIVLFAILALFMVETQPHHRKVIPVDMPKIGHPVSMRDADREDAMIVSVTRDGKIYFGGDQVDTMALRVKIADHLKDHSVERKVYIKADMRARWGVVKEVLDSVRSAGLMRVAFLVDQRRSVALHM
ncbi:MAG TPA: biopolymer transporter ExbD [Candidatus Binatia bacterium]|nr:biopolymer transporter ExbD [Candidatus Binatia bacterium]